ncbi:PREDICTED: protein S100-A16 [Pygoscelis adeliae]|uniref:protein S100-A16 n=1 Tax=Pygoscelis adeliae TaxID=9238 RepID=UPI0004F4F89A|nr:PREDICTED: protein S100-A16 [Pygoscelis adeliae]
MATGELTELETAIEKIVTVFFTYAGKEGKKGTLTAGEFKELVQLQLPNLMKDTGNRRAADKLICDLDENKDGRISFEEYWTLIGGIASPIAQIIRQQEQSVKHTK